MPCGLSTENEWNGKKKKESELFVILFLLLVFILLLVADDIFLGLLGGPFAVVFCLPLA